MTAKGFDALDVFNGSSNFQSVDLKKSDSGFGFGAGVGINYYLQKNLKLGLGVEYLNRDTYPRVTRDYSGNEPSRISFGNQSVVGGMLALSMDF